VKTVARGSLIALCMMVICGFTSMVAYGQGETIQVAIESTHDTVKNDESFLVSANVKNVSRDEQSLEVWSCSLPKQWLSDNPTVHVPDVPCKKNSATWIRLKPGESYNNQLQIYIALHSDHRTPEPIDFRLGFQPIDFQGTAGVSFPIWSNAVTINVIK